MPLLDGDKEIERLIIHCPQFSSNNIGIIYYNHYNEQSTQKNDFLFKLNPKME
ncbi:hypothetical protein J40TS1_32920 [Paenibacillus montaniterrae]|uniref:Uncharacterized protein n=1 Tax=Paenibacillus montaniterrae TaxID=429341 RepID=A0A919YQN1_9BACL|nr:hypothetical protein J40TS1_32920 [Paenibacillus montaniterrae]